MNRFINLAVFLALVLFFAKCESHRLSKRAVEGLCTNSICKNGANCIQIASNLAVCVCDKGFTGIVCDIPPTTTRPSTTITNPDLCSLKKCTANGQCVQLPNLNLAVCICNPGYSGIFCENGQSINTTPSISSTTPGSNSNTSLPYFTTCPPEASNVCKNGGYCLLATQSNFITCVCPQGYTTNLCE